MTAASSEESVRTELETLLDRFFSPTATNDHRLQLNELLDSFAQQQGVWLWRYCVYFLQTSTNHHLLMYSLNLLENLVTYKWLSIDSAQRVELRQFLTSHLLAHHASLPRFLSNKFVKVITFIGRSDWPHEYPDFIRNILQVTSHLLSVVGILSFSLSSYILRLRILAAISVCSQLSNSIYSRCKLSSI
jgi:hypothetical protein